jgi:hypothetical protein
MLRCWWVKAQMGVTLPQAHCQAGGSRGKFLCPIASSPPLSHLVALSVASHETMIDYKSRLVNNARNNCLMMINGTDFCIQQKGVARKGNLFGSHKYAGKSMLCYKHRVNILERNLIRVEGPYPTGAWPSVNFVYSVLLHCLEPGERVEADNSYVGHAKKIKCPNNDCNPVENLWMQSVARSCHGTLSRHLKNWGILEKVYRHDITAHETVFMRVR